jgi:hypothetical protein
MSDGQEFSRRYHARPQQELDEANTPHARGQAVLDRYMEDKLARLARARRREIPETGEYDPMRRFTEEMAYEEELAGRRYRREVR